MSGMSLCKGASLDKRALVCKGNFLVKGSVFTAVLQQSEFDCGDKPLHKDLDKAPVYRDAPCTKRHA
eukprot:6027084-Amphidinium_carterae.1